MALTSCSQPSDFRTCVLCSDLNTQISYCCCLSYMGVLVALRPYSKLNSWSLFQSLIVILLCFYFGWCHHLPPSLGYKSPNRPSPLLHFSYLVSLPLENQSLFCSQCRGWSHPSPHSSFYSGHVAHGLSSHSIPLAAVTDSVIYTVGPTTLSPKTGSWTQWSLNWKFFMLIHPGSSP